MATTRYVRIAFRLPPALPLKYQQLADRYGHTRSDLYRLGLEHGLAAVARWCERSAAVLDLGSVPGGVPDLASASDVSDSAASTNSSSQTPLSRLAQYAKTLVGSASAGDASELNRQLLEKADALGLSRTQSQPYVDVLAAGVFHQSASAAATARRSSRKRSPSSSSSEPPLAAPAGDSPLSEVPELD